MDTFLCGAVLRIFFGSMCAFLSSPGGESKEGRPRIAGFVTLVHDSNAIPASWCK